MKFCCIHDLHTLNANSCKIQTACHAKDLCNHYYILTISTCLKCFDEHTHKPFKLRVKCN